MAADSAFESEPAAVAYDDAAAPSFSAAAQAVERTGVPRTLEGKRKIALKIAGGTTTLQPAQGDVYVITIASHAEATIIEQSAGTVTLVVLLSPGARLRYFTSTAGQSAPSRTVYLEQDAHLDWIDASIGSTRSDNLAYLQGSGASAKFRSLFVGIGDEQYHVAARMIHEGTRSSSNMLTRAALLDKSHGTYRGHIKILPAATGCDAYQREDTLLLGDESRMDAEPVLEIENDDVKCSHGVTVGQVDAERLFYLESRGIDRAKATGMIVGGFFDQMLISMGDHGASLRDRIAARLNRNAAQELGCAADFPILKRRMNGKALAYLDSAATTQKPASVIAGMKRFYETSYANVHRGIYTLAEDATRQFEEARAKTARFINARIEETIFTRSTTDSINIAARSLATTLNPGDEVVVTAMEHHSNFVPWQQIAAQRGAVFKVIGLTPDDRLDLQDARTKISARTKIVAVAHVSNVLGTLNPVKELARIAHERGAVIVVDGAQAVAHLPVDVKDLDVDFYAFSGHKMYGPDGIGVLYGKRELLERLPPSTWGGEMVSDVTAEKTTWNDLPYKFEAGTPDITQAVGLGLAIDYIQAIGFERIQAHEHGLLAYAMDQLKRTGGLYFVGPQTPEERGGVLAFIVHGVHAHDVAQILSDQGVAVRAGNHCARPLHCEKGILSTTRASIGVYTTKNDIDRLIAGIQKAQETFQ